MKNNSHYKITMLALLLLPLGLFAQSSYFQQASAIAQVSSAYQGTISVTGGEPVPSDLPSFNNLLGKIAKQIMARKTEARSQRQPVVVAAAAAPAMPKPGAVPQPGAVAAVAIPITPAIATPQIESLADVNDTAGLKKELLYILFLGKNTVPNDYLQIKPMPALVYLDEINSLSKAGFFNSGSDGTNFAFSESAIIYGITDFIIQRAKQQLVSVYLNKWQVLLENNCITSTLLPQTIAVTRAFIDDNALDIAVFGDNFKTAYQEDFKNIPVVLQDEATDSVLLKCLGIDDPEITAAVAGGTHLAYNVFLKKHLVRVIEEMSDNYLDENGATKKPVFKKAVVLSGMIADVCGYITTGADKKDTYVTVSTDEIKKLSPAAWTVFARLFFLKKRAALEYLVSSSQITADAVRFVNINEADVKKVSGYFNRTISIFKSYQDEIIGASSKTTQLGFSDTRRIFDLSFQLMGNINDYLALFSCAADTAVYRQKVKPYFGYISEIGEGVSTQQYGKLINGLVGIIATGTANAVTPNNAAATIKSLQRYGSFMINILSAQKPEQVQAALNELIPPGNYQLKNKSALSVSISAYPGLMLAGEAASLYTTNSAGVPNITAPKKNDWAFAPAPFLPIGVDLSWGHLKSGSGSTALYNSVNIFLQALDFGAVLNYRLGGSKDVESDPAITFKQLLSPGIALMTHFTNSPLVLGANLSYSPSLRTINQAGNTYSSGAMRVGIFLGVDVTFFHLYSSRKTR